MKRLSCVLLSLPMVACYGGERANSGQCPAGETCSARTPNGLQFVGNALVDDLLLTGPAATAVGGTQSVALQYDRGDGILIALDLAFDADDDGGIGVAVDHITGSQVIVRGAGSRTNYLRILDGADGTLFDRKELTGAALDTIALVATDFERIPAGADLAWATGDQRLGVALYGDVQHSGGPASERLVDDTMDLSLAGATRTAWDTLTVPTANVGTTAISVTAGDKPAASLDFVVVDHADTLTAIQPAPTTIAPNSSATVCFEASAANRYIVGLSWSFLVDGTTTVKAGDLERNCITVSTPKTTGTVSVQASAGGQALAVNLAVGVAVRQVPQLDMHARTGLSRPGTSAGDRASL